MRRPRSSSATGTGCEHGRVPARGRSRTEGPDSAGRLRAATVAQTCARDRERAPSLRRCAAPKPMVPPRGDREGRRRLVCPGRVDTGGPCVGPSSNFTRRNANLTARLRRRVSRGAARANGGIS